MGGNYSRIHTRPTGGTISGPNDDAEFDNIIANATPAGLDDTSANLAAMQVTVDPSGGSLATSGEGEFHRSRFQHGAVSGKPNWYDTPDTTLLLQFNKGADLVAANDIAAGALTLGIDGNAFDLTDAAGPTAITSIVTRRVGDAIRLHFDDITTLTHHATDLVLPTAANITTAAGDEAVFYEYATGDWRCINYQRADGSPLSFGTAPTFTDYTNANHDHSDAAGGGTLGEDAIDWATAGGLTQMLLLEDELTHTGDLNWTTVKTVRIYIPANANSIESMVETKTSSGTVGNEANFRLQSASADGTDEETNSTSYGWRTALTIDVSADSGWFDVNLQLKQNDAAETAFVDKVSIRII